MFKTQDFSELHTTTLSLKRLRVRWWLVALLYGLVLGGGYLLLPPAWQRQGLAGQWLGLAGLLLGYLLWHFHRGLPQNHRAGETRLLGTLGAGNGLTLLRGLGIGLLAGFLFAPPPTGGLFAWLPAILYTWISVLDYLDGYVARVTNHATRLGERLDAVCDSLGLLVAVGLVVWYGKLPVWFLPVGLASYLFRLGRWWRQRQGRPLFDLPASRRRRLLAGFQMAFISVLLWPLAYPSATATLAGLLFTGPVLAGFGRDWLVVSGRLDASSPRYLSLRAGLTSVLDGWLPPLLRAGVALLSLGYLLPIALDTVRRQALLYWPGTPLPALTADLLALLAVVTTLLLLAGLLARVAALGLLVPTLATMLATGLNLANGSILAGVILLLLLGGGRWSLWRLDDVWVTVKAGGAR